MLNLFKEYEGIFNPEVKEDSNIKEKKGRVFNYNPFALQDAIGEKNIKKTWIEYQKLKLAGIGAEEIIHSIVRKVRDMTFIIIGISKEDLGLKDYPYNKSKRDAKNWKELELKNFYTKLIIIYHQSRMTYPNGYSINRIDELEIAIEKILLSI